ncbi:hypothetical protein [Hymenobacter sp. IS2118]|uniref:hypothetical protein n=1 Tax=Hymenobacter sp. IS2118 TaxID=1505605 RepID=UPI001268C994|nr:hypothetical protein [Hymenobacter sp. IS2118]
MPKLIDYPRTTYSGAWELAEITDDTGGKCAIETAARKLNRKVSGSFKAIIGSAVKFGLLTSKRELLTTTTLFKRIKHAYDKQEEIIFHREAFLTPPLFTQLCRKFRSRELPMQMLDVMLIREFGVEEINAQGVAKAFVEGCRMVGLLDENNIVADIDALTTNKSPRRELASIQPAVNTFREETQTPEILESLLPQVRDTEASNLNQADKNLNRNDLSAVNRTQTTFPIHASDAIASLFGLMNNSEPDEAKTQPEADTKPVPHSTFPNEIEHAVAKTHPFTAIDAKVSRPVQQTVPQPVVTTGYQIQVSGPGVNTILSIYEEEDVAIAMALLQKISRQLKASS